LREREAGLAAERCQARNVDGGNGELPRPAGVDAALGPVTDREGNVVRPAEWLKRYRCGFPVAGETRMRTNLMPGEQGCCRRGFQHGVAAALDAVERGCSPKRLSHRTLAISEWQFDRSHKKRVPPLKIARARPRECRAAIGRHLP
jgi:hypothetical protein